MSIPSAVSQEQDCEFSDWKRQSTGQKAQVLLLNGLYSIAFSAGTGKPAGAGVVVLCDGVLLGGDSSLLYQGTYTQRGGKFEATVRTSRHAHQTPSLFGLDEATLSFAGTIIRGDARGFGASSQVADLQLEVHLSFRAHIS